MADGTDEDLTPQTGSDAPLAPDAVGDDAAVVETEAVIEAVEVYEEGAPAPDSADEVAPDSADEVAPDDAAPAAPEDAAPAEPAEPVEEPLPPHHQEAYDAIAAGDFATAIEEYRKAIAENPRDALAVAGLAQVSLLQRLAGVTAAEVREAAE